MKTISEQHYAAKLRLTLLVLLIPLIAVGAVFIGLEHQNNRKAILNDVSLQSARVNAQLETFLLTVREASAVFGDGH